MKGIKCGDRVFVFTKSDKKYFGIFAIWAISGYKNSAYENRCSRVKIKSVDIKGIVTSNSVSFEFFEKTHFENIKIFSIINLEELDIQLHRFEI